MKKRNHSKPTASVDKELEALVKTVIRQSFFVNPDERKEK